MGFKGWNTREARDDGIDAVVINDNAMVGGQCIIQAKRYSRPVPVESVRALAGTMHDTKATKAILVTTSWFTTDGRAFADRPGESNSPTGDTSRRYSKNTMTPTFASAYPRSPGNGTGVRSG